MLPAVKVSDGQFQAHARVAPHLGLGSGTAGITWPALPGLPSRTLVGGSDPAIRFVGCPASQRRVWPVLIEPVNVGLDLLAEGSLAQGDRDSPQTLVLQGQDEPFDHGETAVLPDSSEAWPDPTALAPSLEVVTSELAALIADEVLGLGLGAETAEEGANLKGRG